MALRLILETADENSPRRISAIDSSQDDVIF
jgi:hypothetical protein